MNQEEVQEAARRQPFAPFRVVLANGDKFDIRHPDLIMVGRRSAMVGVTNEPDGTAYDRTVKIDLFHMVALEELPARQSSSNGENRPRQG